jgi:hypothetical protein
MSYGFEVISGTTGTIVSVNSGNDAVGMFLDFFVVPYNTTFTKSYPSFYGTELYTIVMQQDRTKLNTPTTNINNSTKTVVVTSNSSTSTLRQGNLNVLVLGK